jgi:outer membrane murein-binding lipoprotein Lpp
MILPRKRVAGTAFVLSINLFLGCSSASKTREEINQLSAKVAKIEIQLNQLTSKVNSTQNHQNNIDAWLEPLQYLLRHLKRSTQRIILPSASIRRLLSYSKISNILNQIKSSRNL